MAIAKQSLNVPFMGLDQKSDPFKIAPGKFLSLSNTIPIKGGPSGILLQKRNGFEPLDTLDSSYQYVNTFGGNLVSIGSSVAAYSAASQSSVVKGSITLIDLSTQALVRNSSNQSYADAVSAPNGLVCVVYTETSPSTIYRYAIIEESTGQNIVSPTTLSTPSESPRVFLLSNYFIIVFSQSANLKYISIPINNPSNPSSATTLVTNYQAGALTQPAFDGIISNNNLYISYNASDGGGAIRITYLNSFLVRQTSATGTVLANAKTADIISMCVDSTASPVIWTSFYKTAGTTGYVVAVDSILNSILVATQFISSGTMLNLASVAQSGSVTVFVENSNNYSYGTPLPTNLITKKIITQAGVVSTNYTVLRSIGLASKAFLLDGVPYFLAAYSSPYQPTYFLVTSSAAADGGSVIGKLAYSNGGGYLTLGLPSMMVTDTAAQVAYLIKDLLLPANKNQNPASPLPVFTQTGVNLATFDFTTEGLNASEIGKNLNISGAILWNYDGTQVVEQGFNLWPDNVIVTTSTSGGSISDQTYYYVAVYEWTDNQGNIHRSAPSIAVKQVTSGGNTSTNTIKVPTLRLTYKSLVKIVLYRWSTAQQVYYQVTSISSPTLNSTSADNVTITDTLADSSIVGNSILYTTGGVAEDIQAPPTTVMTLNKSRLFVVDAEDRNLLWFSKQVIEGTPVEFSDLFTVFVAPTISAQGDTGPISSLSAMDDKLVIFKKNAIYYLTGFGPDNTGANNDFSDPVFVTSTIGCENQNSIVFTPNGLMFQSDKGIWLLGRDLSTSYIGAPVENYNDATVLSALTVPGTNQVRFTLDNGVTLLYDYFFGIWGTFDGIPGISSCLFEDLQTFINDTGDILQENPGSYLDGSRPVTMALTTGWFNVGGVQGYERAYFFYLLGTYLSPHKLTIRIAFDYNPNFHQQVIITPENFSGTFGNDTTDPIFGTFSPFGGPGNIEQWRVFLEQQKCEAFQISIQESYDPSFGAVAGAGLTLSGLNLVMGVKSSYPRLKAALQAG
jgi:hypothetical protein